MDDRKTKTMVSVATLIVAARSYTASGAVTAAAATALTLGISYYAMDGERLWKSLSLLKNPFAAGVQFAAVGFVLGALLGLDFYSSGVFAGGGLLLGVAAGLTFNAYWRF
ncbi:MAG: hypothetical protein ABEJ98_01075 [Candidatus Nanohaloarchaea archaeon]